MLERICLPEPVGTILVTRLDALGDIVLGTMLLLGLHEKWPAAKIRVVVRRAMGGVESILPDWVDVRLLPFDPQEPIAGKETEIIASCRAFAEGNRADLVVLGEYNRTWASEILAELCGGANVVALDGPTALNVSHRELCLSLGVGGQERWMMVAADAESRETQKYRALLQAPAAPVQGVEPTIVLRETDRREAADLWADTGLDAGRTIACFPSSGDQLVRSLEAQTWVRWIGRLQISRPVALLGSDADAPALDELERCHLTAGVRRVSVPRERTGLTAAFLERAGAYFGTDTGPMHLAAVMGRPTLGVFGGGYRAERFLPVGRHAAAIRMPLGCYGCEWLCPFDRRLCIKDIPEWPLLETGDAFLDDIPDNADPFSPRIYEFDAPVDLPGVLLGPTMRQHRRFLRLNHEMIEHHAHLAQLNAAHSRKIAELAASAAALGHENHERGLAINHIAQTLAEMTRHNHARDAAIAHVNQTLAEMALQNQARDAVLKRVK